MRTDALHAVRLARMDLKLLGRNTTAMFNVLLLPLLFALMLSQGGEDSFVLTGLPGVMLVFAVFMNLVNSFTARREELVLKRLRGGQGSAVAIFGGAGLAALAVFVLQVALLVVWIERRGGGLPENVPMMLVAAVLGVAVFALLAAAFSGITPNAELAQVAVLPVLIVALLGSPLIVPLSKMPFVVRLVPTTPIVEMMRMGYGGGSWLAALPWIGVLLAWLVVAGLLAKWLFRWDPRHS
ncbi:ABC transporter permease [Nonomuraea africana]|uniref:ABC-2 type transport system permease protein n=1 Tax=Nonomuraea africana TaxID=46171 RepID=A0ABR9KW41_9ACTN|nr:ABC transporter permease [Nonomuraea africana]MBE1566242.1 ABC-2 type transport system permease protein [Nonomuraea africana]